MAENHKEELELLRVSVEEIIRQNSNNIVRNIVSTIREDLEREADNKNRVATEEMRRLMNFRYGLENLAYAFGLKAKAIVLIPGKAEADGRKFMRGTGPLGTITQQDPGSSVCAFNVGELINYFSQNPDLTGLPFGYMLLNDPGHDGASYSRCKFILDENGQVVYRNYIDHPLEKHVSLEDVEILYDPAADPPDEEAAMDEIEPEEEVEERPKKKKKKKKDRDEEDGERKKKKKKKKIK